MMRLIPALLFYGSCYTWVGCVKPSHGRKVARTIDQKIEGSALPENSPESEPVNAGLPFGEWQSVELKVVANPDQTPKTATIGFDKISAVFARQAYGPCSDCHSHEWPYLSMANWPRFLESLSGENHGVATKEDLAILIVGCVDQSSSDHCAGDRDDSSDNLDFKMPTKFGMDPVSADDLTLLQRWLEDGVLEFGLRSAAKLVNSKRSLFYLSAS